MYVLAAGGEQRAAGSGQRGKTGAAG